MTETWGDSQLDNLRLPTIEAPNEIGGYLTTGPVKKATCNSLSVIVDTENGPGWAKIGKGTLDAVKRARRGAELYKRTRQCWPKGVRSLPDIYQYSEELLPDSMGNMHTHPVTVIEFIKSVENEETLAHYIELHGGLGIRGAVHTLFPVALALDAASQAGVIHGDIKPENILMHHSIGLLNDFDQAITIEGEEYKPIDGIVWGTSGYMPPERRRGEKLSHKANGWGLAVTTYYAATEEDLINGDAVPRYFYGSPFVYNAYINDKINSLPPRVRKVMSKALAFNPEERYESCTEFMLAVVDAITGQTGISDVKRNETKWRPFLSGGKKPYIAKHANK